ncbi:MAG: hypothetical protein LBI45_00600 [Bacteroidales bacterium]|jgi:hypothetical protein|nr:hypothetical protein [Bacteroidales bacterium]
MENFKLSKTGIIIIIIAAVVVILLCSIFFIAGKKTAEIKQENENKENRKNALGEEEKELNADLALFPIFDDYRAGKITSKDAIKMSGLSVGSFYRKLNKYETTK